MTLGPQNTFIYSYGIGGCQGEVTGTWTINNERIKFKNDDEFKTDSIGYVNLVVNDTLTLKISKPFYPDLSITDWKIKSKSLIPIGIVDSGCLTERGRHRKK